MDPIINQFIAGGPDQVYDDFRPIDADRVAKLPSDIRSLVQALAAKPAGESPFAGLFPLKAFRRPDHGDFLDKVWEKLEAAGLCDLGCLGHPEDRTGFEQFEMVDGVMCGLRPHYHSCVLYVSEYAPRYFAVFMSYGGKSKEECVDTNEVSLTPMSPSLEDYPEKVRAALEEFGLQPIDPEWIALPISAQGAYRATPSKGYGAFRIFHALFGE